MQSNEVLQFPALYTDTGFTPGYSLKGWEWSNRKAKRTEVWNYGVRASMYSLPIPLSGHCVVTINRRFVVFLGGATTEFKEDGTIILNTGPEPTSHIHIYNLDNESWETTFLGQSNTLRKMSVPRYNCNKV